MAKTTRTITMEISVWEAAKAAGLNISEAAEQGIQRALGVDLVVRRETDPLGVYFDALDATERSQIVMAHKTGEYKTPGFFGKVVKCPRPERRLHAILKCKYRFNQITEDEVRAVLSRLVNNAVAGGTP
jgi:hypothetical protein